MGECGGEVKEFRERLCVWAVNDANYVVRDIEMAGL